MKHKIDLYKTQNKVQNKIQYKVQYKNKQIVLKKNQQKKQNNQKMIDKLTLKTKKKENYQMKKII